MRLTNFLVLSLLTLAICNTTPECNDQDIAKFYNGLFDFFNLPSPSQAIACFDDFHAGLFFESLYERFEILKDTTERKSFALHLEFAKLWLLSKSLESTFNCVVQTQDFTDLMDALNVTNRSPDVLGLVSYIIYQAHYVDFYEAYQPLIESLNVKNFTDAGTIFGSILMYKVDTVKEEGLGRLAYNGYGNGESIRLGIDEPVDSLECYDNNSSALYIHFLYRLAVVVTEGKISDVLNNSVAFLENEGRDIMEQFPEGLMDCIQNSDDYRKKADKLGMDIYTPEFLGLMKVFVDDHRIWTYYHLTLLKGSIENHNFIHSGELYAHFLLRVANSAN